MPRLAAYAGWPVGSFAQARPEEVATWQGKDALSGLFALYTDVNTKQRSFEARPDYTQLREYTDEEQADDFALTMMGVEGMDIGQMTSFFLDFSANETARARCSDILANGVVPPYSFLNPHHGNCYRAYHAGQFRQYLANGGVGVVIPNIPKPAAQAMTARRNGPLDPKPRKNSTFRVWSSLTSP